MAESAEVALIRHWFEHGLNAAAPEYVQAVAAEVFADDFLDHDGLGNGVSGREAWLRTVVEPVRAAFSDVEVDVRLAFGSDDLLCVRYVFAGTHTGTFAGATATGRRIRHPENEIYRFENGRVAESWGEGDWLGTLRQLGVLPGPPAP